MSYICKVLRTGLAQYMLVLVINGALLQQSNWVFQFTCTNGDGPLVLFIVGNESKWEENECLGNPR